MSRLTVPLKYLTLWSTGDILLRAELDLRLRDETGGWRPETFRVDSGSAISLMPAWRARSLGLPIPQHAVSILLTTAAGQAVTPVRSGLLRFKVDGMDPTEYAVPCHFTGDPHRPPLAALPPNLSGLSGVVDKLRFTFDGTPVPPGAPYGVVAVEKV